MKKHARICRKVSLHVKAKEAPVNSEIQARGPVMCDMLNLIGTLADSPDRQTYLMWNAAVCGGQNRCGRPQIPQVS